MRIIHVYIYNIYIYTRTCTEALINIFKTFMYRPIGVWLLLVLTPCGICHFNLFLLCIFLHHLFFLCLLLIFFFLIIPIPLFLPLCVANIQPDRQIQGGTETEVMMPEGRHISERRIEERVLP